MIGFQQSMQAAGLTPPEHIEPGRFHRFPGIGKQGGTAGWCKMFPDGLGGTFGDYSTGLNESWQAKRERPFTGDELVVFRRQVEEAWRHAEEQRHREQQQAAAKANAILSGAVGDPTGHAYTVNKKVSFGSLVKRGPWAQRGWPDALLVPMYDESGAVVSVQAINTDGTKDFIARGKKKGCFHPLGIIRGATGRVLTGEGLATVAAAVDATGLPGVVAFDAGNLLPVAEVVRRLAPGAEIVTLADDDQKPDTEKNAGIEASTRAALAVGGSVAIPAMGKKADFWDLWSEQGEEAVRVAIGAASLAGNQPANQAPTSNLSPRDRLSALSVQKEYVAMIGNEEWLFKNLIIKNQIVVLIAKSGGGKTTICFDFISPWMIEHHAVTVFYFDLDSPASDHARMHEIAQKIGPRFHWINPLTHGKGVDELMEILKQFVESGERLDNTVFDFDTTKKFIDVLDKRSVKPFFNLMRQLTALGATIVLLGHANKHRANDGTLIFEGVGDIQSDADALIFLERIQATDGGQHVTTVVDPDKGAKVRGLYEPITFHIAKDRTVTLCDNVFPVPDWQPTSAKKDKLTQEDILERIREYLSEQPEPVQQGHITDALMVVPGASFHRVRQTLISCAVPQHEATQPGQIYHINCGLFNRKTYGVVK